MSGKWPRRRLSGEQQPNRYPDFEFTNNHLMFTNPPPPLYLPVHLPPPCYPTSQPTHRYQDPQGVSPPAGPFMDCADTPSPRTSNCSSQTSSMFRYSISPPLSTSFAAHAQGYLKCHFCPSILPSNSLSSHLSTTHSSLMFHCKANASPGIVCNQQFLSVPQLRTHLYTQHMITTFSSDKLARAGTINLPTDLRMYKCKRCPADQDTFYGSSDQLSSHISALHPEVTTSPVRRVFGFECRACEKYPLDDLAHLVKHIKLRHGKTRTRERSVELIACPLPQQSPSPEYVDHVSPQDVEHEILDRMEPDMTRCSMCPSPGLVHKDQVKSHQRSHTTALFTCAACKLNFEKYQDVENHIRVRHKVTQDSSIRESIMLPIREQLMTMRCGVCHRQFVGQEERVLRSHIEFTHGKYYVGMGDGKNLLRLCRVCGEIFRDGVKMQKHLDCEHPPDMFAEDSDNDGKISANIDPSPTVTATTTTGRVAFMDIFKEEVSKRKAEYEKQEAEMKRLRKLLSSESNASDDDFDVDVVELKSRKKKKREKERKKSKKKHKTERKQISDEERKRKYSELDTNSNSDNPELYEYKNPENNNKLSKNKNQSKQGDQPEDDIDFLKMSSTEKLLEAQDFIRTSIEREEKRNKAASFEDDLRRMKEQLSETLRRSRELTHKVREETRKDTSDQFNNNKTVIATKISSESPDQPSQHQPSQPRPKFRMTWKK